MLPSALGRGVAASVSAELDQSHLNEAIAALRNIPEVLECHAPAGETDLLIRVVAKSPDDLYRVSEEIRTPGSCGPPPACSCARSSLPDHGAAGHLSVGGAN